MVLQRMWRIVATSGLTSGLANDLLIVLLVILLVIMLTLTVVNIANHAGHYQQLPGDVFALAFKLFPRIFASIHVWLHLPVYGGYM